MDPQHIKVVPLKSWSEFKSQVEKIYEDTGKRHQTSGGHVSEPVFRGQADSLWKLESSLDRHWGPGMAFRTYHDGYLLPAVSQLKDTLNLEIPPTIDSEPEFRDFGRNAPWYPSMATLRHHGFPAPLLDWTYSPYVAAFFAFNEKRDVENVAVFAYREFCGSGKGYEGNKPRIETFGPSAPIHHRHIRQQNTYTIALKKSDTGLVFASYEEAFQKRPLDFLSFDEVTKFEISAVARDDAIIDLIKMNVTEYSLFGSDDALVKTIAQLLKYRKW